MPWDDHDFSGKLLRAVDFAAQKHRRQRRKDAEGSPYINHPIAVAALLVREAEIRDLVCLQAALLHDTLEDTDATADEIEALCGRVVLQVVQEVTDDKSLPQAERKQRQIAHAPNLSPRARLIRLADKISNLRELSSTAPAGWSLERKREYLNWAEAVVNAIRGSHASLEKLFDKTVAEKRAMLG
jgi:GTP diphosphokinase / guanosine-3',5'-bis(diphosphate) 3'-diphosphatase